MSKSEQTKRGIARAFVSMVESQPLEKVNVSKLVDAMGINRKTFYYHFTDKTDLVIWTDDPLRVIGGRSWKTFVNGQLVCEDEA